MSEKLDTWIASWWREEKRPDSLAAGQLWTVFDPEPRQEAPGAIVGVVELGEEVSLVAPMHHEESARTPCEMVLGSEELSFSDRLVAVVERASLIANEAFEDARFLGTMTGAALGRLLGKVEGYQAIADALEDVRAAEAGGEVSDQVVESAFEAGALRLVAAGSTFVRRADLLRGLEFNLAPWRARAETVALENGFAAMRERAARRGQANVVGPEALYRSMNDLLDDAPKELVNANALGGDAGVSNLLTGEQTRPGLDDLNLFRALVAARLNNWDEANRFFRTLIESQKRRLALRGLVWLSRNRNLGDADEALAMADEIADEIEEVSAEELVLEADRQPLSEFMELDDLDSEIIGLWRRIESVA